MSLIIEPDVDRYGKYARVSSLADFLEIEALKNKISISQPGLAGYIEENDWASKVPEHYTQSARAPTTEGFDFTYDDTQHRSEEYAKFVFEMIESRKRTLNGLYPFEIEMKRVKLIEEKKYCIYNYLLSLSMAHVEKISFSTNIRAMFEETVAKSLDSMNVLSENFSSLRRESSNFESAINKLGNRLHLKPDTSQATISKFANDEGVDAAANLWLKDDRLGRCVLLVQTTCSKTEKLKEKAFEPAGDDWNNILGLMTDHNPFLAIPYHVRETFMRRLMAKSSGTVIIDRLRITNLLENCEANSTEKELIDEVLTADVISD